MIVCASCGRPVTTEAERIELIGLCEDCRITQIVNDMIWYAERMSKDSDKEVEA